MITTTPQEKSCEDALSLDYFLVDTVGRFFGDLELTFGVGDRIIDTFTCPININPLGVHFATEQVRWETGETPVLLKARMKEENDSL